MTVLAARDEFVYRPMTVRRPLSFARRAGALPLPADRQGRRRRGLIVDSSDARSARSIRTASATPPAGQALEYDALVLALARVEASIGCSKDAVTIDDRHVEKKVLRADPGRGAGGFRQEASRSSHRGTHGLATAALRAGADDRRARL